MDEFTNWKEIIYKAIVNVADIEFQKQAWLSTTPEVSSSFVETISTLYDDSSFVKFLTPSSWKCLNLSDNIYKEMNSLKDMIDCYNEPETHAAILLDPHWHDIIKQAQKVILLFEKEM